MKRILILLIALLFTLPAVAQVGRFKNIKVLYPGYSLKLDTATGELSAVHYDDEADMLLEEVISAKKSRSHKEIGRYEFRRTRKIGTYQIFDTASGEYTTVKWSPKNKNGEEIGVEIDTVMSTVVEGLKNLLKGMEEGLSKLTEGEAEELIDL